MDIEQQTERLIFERITNKDVPAGLIYLKTAKNFEESFNIKTATVFFSICQSQCQLDVHGKVFKSTANRFEIIPAGSKLYLAAKSSVCQSLLLSFDNNLIETVSKVHKLSKNELTKVFKKAQSYSRYNWLNEIINRYLYEIKHIDPPDPATVGFLAVEICKEVFYSTKKTNEKLVTSFNLDKTHFDGRSDITKKAVDFIEAHLFYHIGIKSLAKKVGASESRLYRNFMEDLGVSPARFIKDRRLDHALFLLKNPQFDVAQVAYQLNYQTVSAFISAFKKRFGKTPGQISAN